MNLEELGAGMRAVREAHERCDRDQDAPRHPFDQCPLYRDFMELARRRDAPLVSSDQDLRKALLQIIRVSQDVIHGFALDHNTGGENYEFPELEEAIDQGLAALAGIRDE